MIQTPDPRMYACLHEAVADVLGFLGDDEDQVLVMLAAAGVPGWPGHPHMDPLVRWLAQALPDVGVTLAAGDRLLVWAGGADVALVPLPEPVAGALARLAAGEEPRLVLQLEPPAQLPGPDLADVYPDPDSPDARYGLVAEAGPELVDLPLGTRVIPAALVEATIPIGELAPVAAGPAPARQYDTVALPAVTPAGGASAYQRLADLAGDGGRVAVRVAIVCGIGALACFLLAAGGVWATPGAVVALLWPAATGVLLFFRPRGYMARHSAGYQPAHAAWVAR